MIHERKVVAGRVSRGLAKIGRVAAVPFSELSDQQASYRHGASWSLISARRNLGWCSRHARDVPKQPAFVSCADVDACPTCQDGIEAARERAAVRRHERRKKDNPAQFWLPGFD